MFVCIFEQHIATHQYKHHQYKQHWHHHNNITICISFSKGILRYDTILYYSFNFCCGSPFLKPLTLLGRGSSRYKVVTLREKYRMKMRKKTFSIFIFMVCAHRAWTWQDNVSIPFYKYRGESK